MPSVVNRIVAAKHSPFAASEAVQSVGATVGTESANAINVALQFKKANGVNVGSRASVSIFLGTSTTDPTIVATAPDGGIAIGTNGAVHAVIASKKLDVICNTSGQADFTITESTAKAFYVWAVYPDGSVSYLTTVTFA